MFGTAEMSFVGSLPVHTNFWDLCVRPEFQDLSEQPAIVLLLNHIKTFA